LVHGTYKVGADGCQGLEVCVCDVANPWLATAAVQQGMHCAAADFCTPGMSQVAHGELTEAPLETLSALAQSVFLPLLTARINQEGWPDVVAQEVSDSMHRLVATGVLVVVLRACNRTYVCQPVGLFAALQDMQ
jgi:hypothetical protein